MSAVHPPLCPDGTEAGDLPADAPCPERDRPAVLAATILASSMAFVDGSVVHVALPAIQADPNTAFSDLQWIVNGYTLMLGALLLAGGSLGDQAGRRRVFAGGIALFALASIACALAPGARSLTASRVVQGVGAALLVPQSLAIIAASFPRAVRGPAIGTWAAFSALTTSAGPAIGGVLIDAASWRAAFWINVPLAAVALYLTLRRVPESRSAQRQRVDWLGAALAGTSETSALLKSVEVGRDGGFTSTIPRNRRDPSLGDRLNPRFRGIVGPNLEGQPGPASRPRKRPRPRPPARGPTPCDCT